MKINAVNVDFKQDTAHTSPKKREFIDIIADNVKNPRDVQDCVAVPRGIFKAYILLMIGSSLMLIAAALPQKWKAAKSVLNIASAVFSGLSAVYFAKPFAVNGLSPTVTKDK